MSDTRTVGDLFPSRRELLKLGGYGLLAASVMRPGRCGLLPAGERATLAVMRAMCCFSKFPARSVTSSRLTSRRIPARPRIWMCARSTPICTCRTCCSPALKVRWTRSRVRSLLSHEEVHFRGQYYVQTGRQLNLAFAREIPAIGWVIASELESRRRSQDTFPRPTCPLTWTRRFRERSHPVYPRPRRFSVVDINPDSAVKGMALDQKAIELLEERWRLLTVLAEVSRPRLLAMGAKWPATKISMRQRTNC